MASFGNLETDIPFLVELMEEHEVVHGLAERAIELLDEAAAGGPAERQAAFAVVRDLDAYLAEDMVFHIAKEEDVLFPALRGFAADLDKVVVEMVEQHDEVRARCAAIEAAMRALDAEHERVEDAKGALNGLYARHPPRLLRGIVPRCGTAKDMEATERKRRLREERGRSGRLGRGG